MYLQVKEIRKKIKIKKLKKMLDKLKKI